MSNRPDVAILLDHFGSGGVERVACHVANGLHRRGFKVEMVVLEDEGPVRTILDPGVRVCVLGRVPTNRRARRMKAAAPAVAAYLRSARPKLLHAPGNHTIRPASLAMTLARFRGVFVPKITNPLLKHRMSARRQWLRRIFYGWALRKARVILALSESGIDQIAGIDPTLRARTRAIHNPYVSDEMMRSSDQRRPAVPPVILSLGRLSGQKHHAMLLRAAARLGERPWRLRICGTGPKEQSLKVLAGELGIADRVEFPGFVPNPVPELLSATVLAMSSRWEGLPATAIEAIACGCPVVSTASSSGLVDLLREVGALEPVAINDEEGLGRALEAALDGELPPVSSNSVLAYGIEASCDEHAAVFAGLLGAPA